MVEKIFYKTVSLLMALLVLFSTVSFTIEKHFCGDTLIDVAVFAEANKCMMEVVEIEQATTIKMDCCKDEMELVKGQDILKLTKFDDLHFDQQFLLTSLIYSYNNLFLGLNKQIIPHKNYSPPNLVTDIQVLDQVFTI